MYRPEIQHHIEDYITNCGFPVSDWDIDSWTDAARDYMDAAGIDSCDDIPEDIWTEMAIRFDASEVFTRVSADGSKRVTVYRNGPKNYPFNATFYRHEFGMWVEAGYGRYCRTLEEAKTYAAEVTM